MRVTPQAVADALARAGTSIPAPFYLGVVSHESGFKLDAQTPESGGRVSLGLFQILAGEVNQSYSTAAFLNSLDAQAELMVRRTEANRARLRDAAGLAPGDPDPWDMGAYLALAHNQGIGAALETVNTYGMDWVAYKARNPGARILAYGDDCLYDAGLRYRANLAWGMAGLLLAVGIAAATAAGAT